MQGTIGIHGTASDATLDVRVIEPSRSGERCLPEGGSPKWAELAIAMQSLPADALGDAPQLDENLFLPAGYTYFAQFITHDLTFEPPTFLTRPAGSTGVPTPSAEANEGRRMLAPVEPDRPRTPRLDLDSVYGAGPSDAPYLYAPDEASLLLGATPAGKLDLPRTNPGVPGHGRAIIGDPRNDENSLICQIHVAFIRFHNAVVQRLAEGGTTASPFRRARDEVRWTYQRIVVEDLLPRLVRRAIVEDFERARVPDARGRSTKAGAYRLAKLPLNAVPREFSKAAFRLGHSLVRDGYRLNPQHGPFRLFGRNAAERARDLVGFEPLDDAHVIDDWSLLFPDAAREGHGVPRPGHKRNANYDADGRRRLQYAHRIDTSLADPLGMLPDRIAQTFGRSLVLRDLLASLDLATGQEVASKLGVQVLNPRYLCTRKKDPANPAAIDFVPIDRVFHECTPLWFYVLAEAQQPVLDAFEAWKRARHPIDDGRFFLEDPTGSGSQLGPVGGAIVLETFHGLLDGDPGSYRNDPAAAHWTPLLERMRMWDLVNLNFR